MKKIFFTLLTLTVVGMVLLYVFADRAEEQTIGIGQHIHHDDFEYSVQKVETVQQIGTDSAQKGHHFVVVSFRVQNDAKRVSHEWDSQIAFVTDGSKLIIENNPTLRKSWCQHHDTTCPERFDTPAGVTESTTLVFEVPNTLTQPYLMVKGATLMGDFFDGGQFEKTKIKL